MTLRLLLPLFAFFVALSPKPLMAQGAQGGLPPFAASAALYLMYSGSSANRANNQIVQISRQGEITTALTAAEIIAVTKEEFATFDDRALGFGPDGTLYFSDNFGDALLAKPRNGQLAILTSTQAITELTSITTSVSLGMPAVGLDGNVYVVERTSDNVLRIDPSTGEPEIFVSKAELAGVITDTVSLFAPLVFDTQGAMYLIDTTTRQEGFSIFITPDQIVKVTPDGVPAILVPTGVVSATRWLAFTPDGALLASDSVAQMVHAIAPTGEVTPYLNTSEIAAPLQADEVSLQQNIAVDSAGNLFIHEARTDSILRFDTALQGSILVSGEELEAAVGFPIAGNMGMAFAPGYPLWLPALEKQ